MRKPILSRMIACLAVSSLALLPVCVGANAHEAAAEGPPPAGHWAGEIEIPGTKLGFDIGFTQKPDGSWSGDISIPMQNAKDLPLASIMLKGNVVARELFQPGAVFEANRQEKLRLIQLSINWETRSFRRSRLSLRKNQPFSPDSQPESGVCGHKIAEEY